MDGPPGMPPPSEILIPVSDVAAHRARIHVAVTTPLLVLCLVPFCTRIYIRTWPRWNVWWDDLFILLGFMSAITDWVLLQFEMFMTPQLLPFETAKRAGKLAYLAIPVWSCTMTFIKISVALTLLRLPLGKWWKVFLYTMAALQVAFFVGNLVYTFMTCIPLAAVWDITLPSPQCLPRRTAFIASTVGSTLSALTDILLSVAPMLLVWQLRRPLRERILVSVLTGTGLVAGASSIAKVFVVRDWTEAMEAAPGTADIWALSVPIATLTIVEQFGALLAATSPSLKGPVQRLLRSAGVLLTHYESRISFIHSPTRINGEKSRMEEKPMETSQGTSQDPSDALEDGNGNGHETRATSNSVRG